MKYIKFRQKVINEHGIKVFHYWGIMDNGSFIAPIESANHTYWVALENSEKYTGLHDKYNTKIYEGDIVRILYTDWASKSADDPRTLEQYLIDKSMLAEVVFNEDCYCLKIKDKKYGDYSFCSIFPGKYGFIEVIGNIYENPELLEAK